MCQLGIKIRVCQNSITALQGLNVSYFHANDKCKTHPFPRLTYFYYLIKKKKRNN